MGIVVTEHALKRFRERVNPAAERAEVQEALSGSEVLSRRRRLQLRDELRSYIGEKAVKTHILTRTPRPGTELRYSEALKLLFVVQDGRRLITVFPIHRVAA